MKNKTMEIVEVNGSKILFSYETPVAAVKDGEFYRTNKFYSKTTSRHVNEFQRDSFFGTKEHNLVDPVFFTSLLGTSEVK